MAATLIKPAIMTPEARQQIIDGWEAARRAWEPIVRECRALCDGSTRNVTCPTCATAFSPMRTDQRFCSGKCRQAAYRGRLMDVPSAKPVGAREEQPPEDSATPPTNPPSKGIWEHAPALVKLVLALEAQGLNDRQIGQRVRASGLAGPTPGDWIIGSILEENGRRPAGHGEPK